jgi:hypothetical protein
VFGLCAVGLQGRCASRATIVLMGASITACRGGVGRGDDRGIPVRRSGGRYVRFKCVRLAMAAMSSGGSIGFAICI